MFRFDYFTLIYISTLSILRGFYTKSCTIHYIQRFTDYPVDFSSKNSACGVSDTGVQHGSDNKDLTGQNRSLNNGDKRNRQYNLSETSDGDEDEDEEEEVDGAEDEEIIDIVGDHSHIMLNNDVSRNFEHQRFF